MAVRRGRLLFSAVLLALLIAVAVLPECVDAKKKKKSAAKKAREAEAEAKKKSEDDEEEEEEKKPKKPWNKMTKADWDRLEREAEGPGEPYKPPEPPNIPFDPKNPMEYVKASKKGKPAMMFASLDKIKDKKSGEMRDRTKEETEEVAFKHKSLMQSGHLDGTPYVIDPNKILWTVQDGSKGYQVKHFLMQQPEVVEFEWEQQKTTKDNYKPTELETEL